MLVLVNLLSCYLVHPHPSLASLGGRSSVGHAHARRDGLPHCFERLYFSQPPSCFRNGKRGLKRDAALCPSSCRPSRTSTVRWPCPLFGRCMLLPSLSSPPPLLKPSMGFLPPGRGVSLGKIFFINARSGEPGLRARSGLPGRGPRAGLGGFGGGPGPARGVGKECECVYQSKLDPSTGAAS